MTEAAPVVTPEVATRPEAILQLGKNGDLINLLPLFLKDYQRTGQKTHVIVAREYADLLEGVTYVEPHIFDGGAFEIEKAIEFSTQFACAVRISQVLGPPDIIKKYVFDPMGRGHAMTESFQKEAWLALGRLNEWREQLPLVFDNRSAAREEALVKEHRDHRKKMILVHAEGASSPFPYKELLLELVKLKFKRGFNVVDLGQVKAERIYDLLGLMEKAWALIAIDSAPLHLAYACPDLPVVALVNDKPVLWNGSVWRPNHIAHIRYGDFPKRAPQMLEAIDNLTAPGVYPFCRPAEGAPPQIIHAWSQYDLVEDPIRERYEETRDLWLEQYDSRPAVWIRCPIEVGAIGRDSRTELRDQYRRFPYVRDVLRLAMQRAREQDIICLTRPDTGFVPGEWFTEAVLTAGQGPIYSHRWVFTSSGKQYHPSIDLFAFTKAWWREHQHEYPDMIMGLDPYWHQVLKLLIDKYGGRELRLTHRAAPRKDAKRAEKPAKYVPRNEDLRAAFFKKHNIVSLKPPIAQQVKTHVINRRALSHAGYNPSIVLFNSRLLMAYRWHDEHNPSTSLMMAELNDKYEVLTNRAIEIPGASIEDPRLFTLRGALYICYVDSTWPQTPPSSVVRYARLVEGATWKLEEIHQPTLPENDGTKMQKNWVMFEHDNRLFCIHHTSPEQVVYELRGPEPIAEWRSPVPHWPWGNVRGGTVPAPYSPGKMIRFVHSRLDNEPVPNYWRYYACAALCEDKPPFTITKLSKEPMLIGSEADDTTDMERASISHRKANVIFPAGAIPRPDHWLVSCGCNDCSCILCAIKEEDLKL